MCGNTLKEYVILSHCYQADREYSVTMVLIQN
jgi:hypothetical protein